MTVTNKTNKVEEAGDGVETEFTFAFPALNTTDIVVYKVNTTTLVATLQTVTTDYTVALNATTEGGTVTYVVAPTATENSFIKRVMDLDQQTEVPTEGNIPESSLNNEFDKGCMIDIQLEEETSRALKYAETSSLSDIVLPEGTSAANRAEKIVAWDSAGTGLELITRVTAGATELADDLSPQLGGNLDMNGFAITTGNVGIGTSTPQGLLHLANTIPHVILEKTDEATDLKKWRMFMNGTGLQIGTVNDTFSTGQPAVIFDRDNTDAITLTRFFYGSTSEAMRISADGNVGVTTNSFGASAVGVLAIGASTAPTGAATDAVQLYSLDLGGAGSNSLGIYQENAVVAEVDETKFSHKMPISINGTTYYMMLTQT